MENEMRAIEALETECAVKIQAAFRGLKAREEIEEILLEKRVHECAVKVQAAFRAYLVRVSIRD